MSNEEQARDLVLLDRCLTKLAVSTDESLQGAVHDILAPVLNKLGSTNDSSVKKKAIEVILTIQGLIKEKKELLLPLVRVLLYFFIYFFLGFLTYLCFRMRSLPRSEKPLDHELLLWCSSTWRLSASNRELL